jgi:hypothetical protein
LPATTDQIRSGFAALREVCDPRGWDLLDALEDTCLLAVVGCDTMADAVQQLRERKPSDLPARIAPYTMDAA